MDKFELPRLIQVVVKEYGALGALFWLAEALEDGHTRGVQHDAAEDIRAACRHVIDFKGTVV